MMAGIIYSLCALTSLVCAVLLLAAWWRSRYRLLLWSGICFAGLAISNAVLVVDKLLTPPEVDLSTWRYVITLISMLFLLYGLIWNAE